MSAPATEELRELERELLIAAEQGETRPFAALQEQLSLGAGQLREMLGTLREHGKAVEESPGVWAGPSASAESEPTGASEAARVDEDGRVRVHVSQPEDAAGEDWYEEPLVEQRPASVRLTFGVAQALDAPALGALVKAGIDEAREQGQPFVLEVA